MSLNKYNSETGELTTLASGTRMWIGTKSAHDLAAAAGTLPSNCLISIIDDAPDSDATDDYSTDETKTYSKWIDGKPIYRRVFTFNRITVNADAAWHTIIASSAVPSVGKLLNYRLISDITDWTIAALARFNSGNFQVYPCAGLNISIDTVIIEYTKITD